MGRQIPAVLLGRGAVYSRLDKKSKHFVQGLLVRGDPGRQRLPHYCAHSTSAGIVQVETGAQESAKVTHTPA